MTADVKKVIQKIYNYDLFESELYFVGGTALSFYLEHRISEDIDIVFSKMLPYDKIVPTITSLGAKKLQDENVTALRMAGLFPDEYILKFILDGVKIEFFQANRPIQKEILSNASFTNFENSRLKILDLKSVAKLKMVALVLREKSRDLFDFKTTLEKNILTREQILEIASQTIKEIDSYKTLYSFIENMQVAIDDEIVYMDEKEPKPLNWDEIHSEVLSLLSSTNS